MSLVEDGFVTFAFDGSLAAWAAQAYDFARTIAADPEVRARNLRHGETWFVGVDALPNDAAGAVAGVPLLGPWEAHVPRLPLHPAQLSIMYPGYPKQDAGESDGAYRYRKTRGAAHVDGLLPQGAARRRFALEYHAYILGIPLNSCASAQTLVWAGSHKILGRALREALAGAPDMGAVDVTDAYHAARREAFAATSPVALGGSPGTCFLIHRHALHGTAVWDGPGCAEGRMTAFFRPAFSDPALWLAE